MKKWANYLISEVSYDQDHLISMAKRHEDTEMGISKGQFVDRIKISSDIASGLSYLTIYNRISTWKKGNEIHFFRIDGEPFVRIDKNKVNQDYLGDIPETDSPSIPKPEEATPEQIARLEQLEKQIAKLESKPSKEELEPQKNSRGSLPKKTDVELPQELDLVPEPLSEPEEATPEQIARLEQLEKQIAKLESKPSKEKPEEATPEQIARLEQLEKQIAKLESRKKELS